jgi:hypothetical protein
MGTPGRMEIAITRTAIDPDGTVKEMYRLFLTSSHSGAVTAELSLRE